jgi:alpha-tubulin suppressor-like RCC1 family protein
MSRFGWMKFCAIALLTCLATSCDESAGLTLEVRVISDLVPEREAANVTAALHTGIANATPSSLATTQRELRFGEPLSRGLWVTTFENIPAGTYTMWVTLTRQSGEILGRRPLTVTLTDDASYTVTLTADCARVECPNAGGSASFIACIAGQCVDPSCSPETPENCPPELDLFCNVDTECSPRTRCSTVSCLEGVCVNQAVESECGFDEFCSPLSGCTAVETPPDAPEDVPGICGDACEPAGEGCRYGFYVCTEGDEDTASCETFSPRVAGYPCVRDDGAGTCSEDAVCVLGRVDGGIPDASTPDMGGTDLDGGSQGDGGLDEGVAEDSATECGTGFVGTPATGCVDIDECMYNVCDTRTTCTNLAGSYDCSPCPAGFEGTGATGCVLANGCDENPCDALTVCNPTGTGTYACSACPSGYAGTGERGCSDIDECDYGGCDPSTTCTNTPGSFTCTACPAGFEGTGATGCVDVDECARGTDTCDPLVRCTNTAGSYQCATCPTGYVGTGATGCMDIDECRANPCDPLTACTNRPGGYACSACPAGYEGSGYDGCGDINECDRVTSSCEPNEHCENLPGSHSCQGLVDIAAAGERTCAVFGDGSVKCWGYGDSFNEPSVGSRDVGTNKKARAVAVGWYHSCVIRTDDTVMCWGQNGNGQLGYGDTSYYYYPDSTVDFGGRAAVDVAIGSSHTCAVVGDGEVACWGWNGQGQLGVGDTTPRYEPAFVNLGAGRTATRIATGDMHSCALLDDNTVKCWGNNGSGQLGVGDTNELRTPSPAISFGGRVVRDLVAGASHTCALFADGNASCWGANGFGQLGVGDTASRNAPTLVSAMPGGRAIEQLVTGYYHTCARLAGGDTTCWGYNEFGALGFGDRLQRNAAQDVIEFGAGENASHIAAGYAHTCAVLGDDVKCWGNNNNGPLGYAREYNRFSPSADVVDFGSGLAATSISLGQQYSCAVLDDGTSKCWGYAGNGVLGDGSGRLQTAPLPSPINMGGPVDSIYTGQSHTCAILTDGRAKCWGYGGNGFNTWIDGESRYVAYGVTGYGDMGTYYAPRSESIDFGRGRTATQFSIGQQFTCALLDGGDVKCWGFNGWNGEGLLGYGNTTALGSTMAPPAEVVDFDGERVQAIGSGANFTCALLGSGDVRCWGSGSMLGTGESTNYTSPAPAVALGRPAVALSVGYQHACALLDDGTAKCWGQNGYGQCGNGETGQLLAPPSAPIDFGAGRTAVAISAGSQFTCALLDDGTAKCWGDNQSGQLGLGFRTDGSGAYAPPAAPIHLAGRGVRAIYAGWQHACAVLGDGETTCWGSNYQGELGLDAFLSPGELPIRLRGR